MTDEEIRAAALAASAQVMSALNSSNNIGPGIRPRRGVGAVSSIETETANIQAVIDLASSFEFYIRTGSWVAPNNPRTGDRR